jgi:hypothetical protein
MSSRWSLSSGFCSKTRVCFSPPYIPPAPHTTSSSISLPWVCLLSCVGHEAPHYIVYSEYSGNIFHILVFVNDD